MRILANSESICAIVAFTPPPIQNAQIQTARADGFHAAGTRSFQGTPGCVEPNITPGNHLARHVHIIVFQKYQITLQIAVFAEVNDELDKAFALVVTGMSLAGENKLDWPRCIASQAHYVAQLMENQRRAFVGREPSRKTDSQRVGVQQVVKRDEIGLGP